MKERPWGEPYLKLSDKDKRNKSIEWCMRLLRENIDGMSDRDFLDFITEYECIVAYPENIGWYHSAYFNNDEREIRDEFKKYKTEAIKLMSIFQQNKEIRQKTIHQYTIRIFNGGYQFVDNDFEHGFEYSFARRIGDFLRGRKFDDGFKRCKHCANYFAEITNHNREFCDHNCAMRFNKKKIFSNNPDLARKRGKISTYFSRITNNVKSEKKRLERLEKYIEDNNYSDKEIPQYIKDSLNKKFNN